MATAATAAAAIGLAPRSVAAPVDSADLDAQVEALVRNPASKTNDALVGGTSLFFVDDYVQPGDTSDVQCWDRALLAAKASPGPSVVRAGARAYVFSRAYSLVGHSDLTIEGAGIGATVISGLLSTTIGAAFVIKSGTAATRNIVFRNLTFSGSLSNGAALTDVARDSRKFVSGWSASGGVTATSTAGTRGLQSSVDFVGRRHASSSPIVSDVAFDSVEFTGFRGCAVKMWGIDGAVSVTDCSSWRCMDMSFRSVESVLFTGNRIELSADNGVSFSSGVQRVVCSGNSIHGSYYSGIWCGGADGLPGPTGVTITGNSIDYSTRHGIVAEGGATTLSITANTVTRVSRQRENWEGCGIYLARLGSAIDLDGDGSTDDERLSASMSISGNTLVDCDRGGILIDEGCSNILVSANMIVRPGRSRRPDGSAPDTATGSDSFGVSTPGTSTANTNIFVSHNMIVDDRNGSSAPSASTLTDDGSRGESPSLAFAVHRPQTAESWYSWDNVASGNLVPHEETGERQLGPYMTIGYPTSYQSSLTLDKAAGGSSSIDLTTAGALRWQFRSDDEPQAEGSETSELQLRYGRDDGSVGTAFSARRSDGRITFQSTLQLSSGSTANRPDPGLAGPGAMFYDTTIRRPIFSDGARWRTSEGATI
ncbi:right-handed parallel beta-helix repeat-containing protein [Rathayibacter sp. VKM Ac-2858]|nr:right-handed parallel beta-helix repeat-containing protein [Rathayibacter sp. VKM Ac-2858]